MDPRDQSPASKRNEVAASAKLDELAANLKRLERVALDNIHIPGQNIRIHALWSALRALSSAVESPVRKTFP